MPSIPPAVGTVTPPRFQGAPAFRLPELSGRPDSCTPWGITASGRQVPRSDAIATAVHASGTSARPIKSNRAKPPSAGPPSASPGPTPDRVRVEQVVGGGGVGANGRCRIAGGPMRLPSSYLDGLWPVL